MRIRFEGFAQRRNRRRLHSSLLVLLPLIYYLVLYPAAAALRKLDTNCHRPAYRVVFSKHAQAVDERINRVQMVIRRTQRRQECSPAKFLVLARRQVYRRYAYLVLILHSLLSLLETLTASPRVKGAQDMSRMDRRPSGV